MTRRNKRFLSLLLALTLAVSLCVLPAAAADQTCPSSKSDPVVFVHGLMGWGERAGLNSVLPYWGMTTGSLTAYLNSLGYETYSATVGPISSERSIVRSRKALSLCDMKSVLNTRCSVSSTVSSGPL